MSQRMGDYCKFAAFTVMMAAFAMVAGGLMWIGITIFEEGLTVDYIDAIVPKYGVDLVRLVFGAMFTLAAVVVLAGICVQWRDALRDVRRHSN